MNKYCKQFYQDTRRRRILKDGTPHDRHVPDVGGLVRLSFDEDEAAGSQVEGIAERTVMRYATVDQLFH